MKASRRAARAAIRCLVASLAQPGSNVTGLSTQFADTGSKRLEILREAAPGLRRLAIIGNVGYPASVLEMSEVQGAARTFGLEVATLEIRRAEDIAPAFEALKDRVKALYICGDSLTVTNRNPIYTFALSARLPTISGVREQLEDGGFISYGPNFPDRYRRVAEIVDKILRGAKPAELPVEQTDEVRARCEPDHGEGAGPHRAAHAARPRRRGDRVRKASDARPLA